MSCRQSHQSYFEKSDLFFVCMLQPLSMDIKPQEAEIEAAQVLLSRLSSIKKSCFFSLKTTFFVSAHVFSTGVHILFEHRGIMSFFHLEAG